MLTGGNTWRSAERGAIQRIAKRAVLEGPYQREALAPMPLFPQSERMEVHFSPEVETRLQQVAVARGEDAEQVIKDAVARMLENQAGLS